MRKAFRNPKQLELSGLVQRPQVEARMAAEIRRSRPQVDRHIPDMACQHPHQLALRLAQLVVQSAQHPAGRKRLVILNKRGGHAQPRKGLRVEHLREPSAVVAKPARTENFHVA